MDGLTEPIRYHEGKIGSKHHTEFPSFKNSNIGIMYLLVLRVGQIRAQILCFLL